MRASMVHGLVTMAKPKTPSLAVLAAVCFLSSIPAHGAETAAIEPVALRTEFLSNPQGLDDPQPRLSWQVVSAERGQRQTAYRLLVASTASKLEADEGDLWDSGRVASSETVNLVYAGRPLGSRQTCFWKVRVWDDEASPPHGAPQPSGPWDCCNPPIGKPNGSPSRTRLRCIRRGIGFFCRRRGITERPSTSKARCGGRPFTVPRSGWPSIISTASAWVTRISNPAGPTTDAAFTTGPMT